MGNALTRLLRRDKSRGKASEETAPAEQGEAAEAGNAGDSIDPPADGAMDAAMDAVG